MEQRVIGQHTDCLFPFIPAGLIKAGGRVINVASTGHHWIKKASELDLEGDMKFEFPRPLRTLEIYVVTKLMNVIFTMELHRKLRGTGKLFFHKRDDEMIEGVEVGLSAVFQKVFGIRGK